MCSTEAPAVPAPWAKARDAAKRPGRRAALALVVVLLGAAVVGVHDMSVTAAFPRLVVFSAATAFASIGLYAREPRHWLYGFGITVLVAGVVWVQRHDLVSPLTAALLLLVAVAAYAVGLMLYRAKPNYNWAEFGVALSTGLVLALAAFILNLVLENAFEGRDLARRQSETRLAINQRSQLSFRGEELLAVDLSGLKITSPAGEPGFDFSNADLRGADLRRADLSRAIFDGADLTGAKFDGAVLVGASLRTAVLHRATFAQASLQGADLQRSRGFDGSGAKLGRATLCPGTGRGESWEPQPVLVGGNGTYHCEPGTGRVAPPPRPGPEEQDATVVVVSLTEGDFERYPIGRVVADDPEGDPVTYRMAGAQLDDGAVLPSGGPFAVNPMTGVVVVDGRLGPGSYLVAVALEEAVAAVDHEDVYEFIRVEVGTKNRPPDGAVAIILPADAMPGHRVGDARAPGVEDASFGLVAGDPDELFLVSPSGTITLQRALPEDSVYTLVIDVFDNGAPEPVVADTIAVTVYSGPPNEPPVIQTTEITLAPSTVVGPTGAVISAVDLDGSDLAYSLVDQPDPQYLDVDEATGELRLLAPLPVGLPPIEITVEVAEPEGGLRARALVRVLVGDRAVAEPRTWSVERGGTLDVAAADGLLRTTTGQEVEEVVPPDHGTLHVDADGGFVYVHDGGDAKSDSFTFRARTPEGDEAEAMVRLLVVDRRSYPARSRTAS